MNDTSRNYFVTHSGFQKQGEGTTRNPPSGCAKLPSPIFHLHFGQPDKATYLLVKLFQGQNEDVKCVSQKGMSTLDVLFRLGVALKQDSLERNYLEMENLEMEV